MENQVNEIKERALKEINGINDLKELEDAKVKYLGKKGELTAILRNMGSLSPEERPKFGAIVNVAKNEVETLMKK